MNTPNHVTIHYPSHACPKCLGSGLHQRRDSYGALDEIACTHRVFKHVPLAAEVVERERKELAFQDWLCEERLERYWAEYEERGGDES